MHAAIRAVGALGLGCLLGLTGSLYGDPCGMVPPIYLGNGEVDEIVRQDAKPSLKRIGVQRTNVFYKNQIESFVIHPGFAGNVSEFGMLIPFPSPPAVRKVSDAVFEHVAAAIDPPEVLVDLQRGGSNTGVGGTGGGGLGAASNRGFRLSIKKEDVQVLSEAGRDRCCL